MQTAVSSEVERQAHVTSECLSNLIAEKGTNLTNLRLHFGKHTQHAQRRNQAKAPAHSVTPGTIIEQAKNNYDPYDLSF